MTETKTFVITIIIAIVVGIGTENYLNSIYIILGFIILTIIWRLLT